MRPPVMSFVIFLLAGGALVVSHLLRTTAVMLDGVDFAILIGIALGFLIGTVNGRWFARDRRHGVVDFTVI